jgi:hypothetical protein
MMWVVSSGDGGAPQPPEEQSADATGSSKTVMAMVCSLTVSDIPGSPWIRFGRESVTSDADGAGF